MLSPKADTAASGSLCIAVTLLPLSHQRHNTQQLNCLMHQNLATEKLRKCPKYFSSKFGAICHFGFFWKCCFIIALLPGSHNAAAYEISAQLCKLG